MRSSSQRSRVVKRSVSERKLGDLLADPANPQFSYFLARVQVTPEGMKTLGTRQMQPGMPAEIVIKTGERSLLTYLLHPLTKRMVASLKEE